MAINLDLQPALQFLDELDKNNNKAWFEENRPAYEDARDRFARLVDYLIDEVRPYDDLQSLRAKDCIFRIYRDVRFSRDKTPYKTNLGALVAPGGRKAVRMGYYFQITPHGGSMVAGGLHMPTSDQLRSFRQAIDTNPSQFKKLLEVGEFVNAFGGIQGEKLQTVPRGYDRAHPDIELLKLKQITVMHAFPDQEVVAPGFPDQVVALWRVMKPFLDYLDRLLH
jgi:uncharacterized protein (TIGR02453 family)